MKGSLSLQDVSVGFPGHTLFDIPNMKIESGQMVAVLGVNGSGKSSLMRTLLGVLEPLSGEIIWQGGRPEIIGYLAQSSEFDRSFPMRVRDLIAMGRWTAQRYQFWLRKVSHQAVAAAARQVGLQDSLDNPVHTLSGGELQRALFARVVMQDSQFIVLDEPFAGIDQTTECLLMDLIDNWRDEGRTIVLTIHDLTTVLKHCDSALLLGSGIATFGHTKDVLTTQNLVRQGYISVDRLAWLEDQGSLLGLKHSA